MRETPKMFESGIRPTKRERLSEERTRGPTASAYTWAIRYLSCSFIRSSSLQIPVSPVSASQFAHLSSPCAAVAGGSPTGGRPRHLLLRRGIALLRSLFPLTPSVCTQLPIPSYYCSISMGFGFRPCRLGHCGSRSRPSSRDGLIRLEP